MGARTGTRPKGSYVFSVGWVHICPQARQLNHWIVPTASPLSRSLLPQLLQNCDGGGRRAGCGAEVFGESIRRSHYAGNCRLNDVLFWTVGMRGDTGDNHSETVKRRSRDLGVRHIEAPHVHTIDVDFLSLDDYADCFPFSHTVSRRYCRALACRSISTSSRIDSHNSRYTSRVQRPRSTISSPAAAHHGGIDTGARISLFENALSDIRLSECYTPLIQN